MKKIPLITILLWLSIICLYRFFPRILFYTGLQYPLIVLLSILLPVSFWLKIEEDKKYQALVFVGIFILNMSLLLLVLGRTYRTQTILEHGLHRGIAPELAQMLTEAETPRQRLLAARLIYRQYAVVMPYKSSGSDLVLYMPSQVDKDLSRKNFVAQARSETQTMNATKQMLTAFLYVFLHAGLFLALLVFLFIYEHKGHEISQDYEKKST